MDKIRIMFMGTPVFAEEILQHLHNLNYNVVATVSQPDRRVGRKKVKKQTPVRKLSDKLNIDCLQPEKIKNAQKEIFSYKPDLIITCAYGQIVPKDVLDFPKYGSFNIHASLLPKLRGGAPIHKAIMYQEEKTGITIMEMSKKMDAGDMVLKKEMPISNEHTTDTLTLDLIQMAKNAMEEALPHIIAQDYEAEKQDESLVTYAYNVSKKEEFISFDRDYDTVDSHIRSLISKPVGYGIVDGKKIKIHKCKRSEIASNAENGEILGMIEGGIGVAVDNKVLILEKVQMENKKSMTAKDFMNGAGQKLIGKKFD